MTLSEILQKILSIVQRAPSAQVQMTDLQDEAFRTLTSLGLALDRIVRLLLSINLRVGKYLQVYVFSVNIAAGLPITTYQIWYFSNVELTT